MLGGKLEAILYVLLTQQSYAVDKDRWITMAIKVTPDFCTNGKIVFSKYPRNVICDKNGNR